MNAPNREEQRPAWWRVAHALVTGDEARHAGTTYALSHYGMGDRLRWDVHRWGVLGSAYRRGREGGSLAEALEWALKPIAAVVVWSAEMDEAAHAECPLDCGPAKQKQTLPNRWDGCEHLLGERGGDVLFAALASEIRYCDACHNPTTPEDARCLHCDTPYEVDYDEQDQQNRLDASRGK
jgi:hypothetical protein